MQGVEGDVAGQLAAKDPLDDEVLLRLKVYRSLGIDLERDGGGVELGVEGDGNGEKAAAPARATSGRGDFTRAVVRCDRRGDVRVVNLDPKFSRFFYANYFWQTL